MVSKIAERIYEKIESGKKLCVLIRFGNSHIMNAVVPDTVDVEDGIYIEGEDLILNISNDAETKITFDEVEDEFIVEQGDVTYYLD